MLFFSPLGLPLAWTCCCSCQGRHAHANIPAPACRSAQVWCVTSVPGVASSLPDGLPLSPRLSHAVAVGDGPDWRWWVQTVQTPTADFLMRRSFPLKFCVWAQIKNRKMTLLLFYQCHATELLCCAAARLRLMSAVDSSGSSHFSHSDGRCQKLWLALDAAVAGRLKVRHKWNVFDSCGVCGSWGGGLPKRTDGVAGSTSH